MSVITTITTKGQVTIPETVRRMLQVKIGDKVSFTQVKPVYKEAVIKIIPADIVDELSGSLSALVKKADYKIARKRAGKILLRKYKVKE